MKCPNCGFEIEKPNQKTCPCCGYKITQGNFVPDEVSSSQETLQSDQLHEEMVSNACHDESPTSQTSPKPIMVECPICHIMVSEETNFCPHCGHRMHDYPNDKQSEVSESSQQFEPEVPEEPETYEDRVDVSDNESDIEQEVLSASQRMDNYRKEDADEYIDNGAYIPDSEEDDEQDDTEGTTHNSGTSLLSQSITFILTAIVSIALGAVLYYVFA